MSAASTTAPKVPFHNALSYDVPGMDDVIVDQIVYDTHEVEGDLTIDLYRAPDHEPRDSSPVVVFVMGYPNDSRQIGGPLKNLNQYKSWGRLVAASGMVGVAYDTMDVDDTSTVIDHLRDHATELGIDPERIALLATSANVGTGLSVAMQAERDHLAAAVFYYGLMYGPEGAFRETIDGVCDDIECYGPELDDYPAIRSDLPILVVKTGRDRADLKETIDRFVDAAETAEAPLTFVDYPTGPHGFETEDQSERSSEIVAQTLRFLQSHLT